MRLIGPLRHTRHKLCAATVVFGSVVLVNDQGLDICEFISYLQPAILKTIRNKIAGDTAGGQVDENAAMVGKQDAIGRYFLPRAKIVVYPFDNDPALPAS